MAKQSWRRVIAYGCGGLVLLFLILGAVGMSWGKGFLQMVHRDKTAIQEAIFASVQNSPTAHPLTHVKKKELEAKLGKFVKLNSVLGEASLEDGLSGKNEYNYFAYCQFEKGEGTMVFRVGNASETPNIISVHAEPGHKKRQRVRHVLTGQFR